MQQQQIGDVVTERVKLQLGQMVLEILSRDVRIEAMERVVAEQVERINALEAKLKAAGIDPAPQPDTAAPKPEEKQGG